MSWKNIQTTLILFILSMAITGWTQDSTLTNKVQNGQSGQQDFIDANGDGYNDNAPDHDNDGIPNGIDPDFQKMTQNQEAEKEKFIDLDGDGINDFVAGEQKEGFTKGNRQTEQANQGGSVETQKGTAKKQKRSGKR